jgi:hypothetical protein
VKGEVGRFDVVVVVVLRVVNLPPFFARYPFVDAANETIDSGVVGEVDDKDRVTFFDSACLSGRGGSFGWFRCGVSVGYVDLRRDVSPVANALFYTIGRVLQSKRVKDS